MGYVDMNDQYAAVVELQEMLRLIGLHSGEALLIIPVNGIYNDSTRSAVKFFQKEAGLQATGDTDFETWNLLVSMKNNIEEPTETISPFPSKEGFVVEPGEKSDLVTMLQIMLNELRMYYDDYEPIAVSGVYDSGTMHGVKSLQEKNALESSGMLDKKTWNRIVCEYNASLKWNE